MLFTALITPFMSASLIGLPAEISESAMQKHLPFISIQPYLKPKPIIYHLKNSSAISISCKFITVLTNTRKLTRNRHPCELLCFSEGKINAALGGFFNVGGDIVVQSFVKLLYLCGGQILDIGENIRKVHGSPFVCFPQQTKDNLLIAKLKRCVNRFWIFDEYFAEIFDDLLKEAANQLYLFEILRNKQDRKQKGIIMALNSGSKIEVADITSALGSKIDTAGTGLSKSGTSLALSSLHSAASTIGSSSAQTLAYSGTFTIPYVSYDEHGRVSGGGERTITMPAASSGYPKVAMLTRDGIQSASTTCTNIGGFVVSYGSRRGEDYPITIKLPSGGTWTWVYPTLVVAGSSAGGTTIISNQITISCVIAIRTA